MVVAPLSQTHTSLTLPDLSPHCNYTMPVPEKELSIGGNVSADKMAILHNQSVTSKLKVLKYSYRVENYFPLHQKRPAL